MARLCPLFSGSDGNAIYISCESGAFLVDAGVSAKRIRTALSDRGLDESKIKGIFITHEHTDHICGLRVLAKHLNVPIISGAATLKALEEKNALPENGKVLAMEKELCFGDLLISRFDTSHDAAGPCGYRFCLSNSVSVAVCTDLGIITDEVREGLRGVRAVLIESNHDLKMLESGPYPYELKMRIASDKGHLSNNTCAAFLPSLLNSGASRFILGHLSQNNNKPELAYSSAEAALMDIGAKNREDYLLSVAGVNGGGELPL